MIRKGYRFRGTASVLSGGELYQRILTFYTREFDLTDVRPERIKAVVLIKVDRVLPLISPGYDSGVTETEVFAWWERYWAGIRGKPSSQRQRSLSRPGSASRTALAGHPCRGKSATRSATLFGCTGRFRRASMGIHLAR